MPRPRSIRAHKKVLGAALRLLAERGIEATSMDAIAECSGVSKATIYNHWKDKDALLLEVLAELHGLHTKPSFDSGDTRADIAAVLGYKAPRRRADLERRLMPHFMAYAALHPKFRGAWGNMAMEPPRRELSRLLAQGIARGELASELDPDVALALLLGPMLYCRIFKESKPLRPADLPERVVDAFWKAFGGGKPRRFKSLRSG